MFQGNICFLGIGKWRYKLIAYTSVLAAVTESKRISHVMEKEGLRILLAGLQMAFMNRFCKFKNKTVNCHMQATSGQAV